MFNYTQFNESDVTFYKIAPLTDLSSGERLFAEVDGRPIVVFNIAGKILAIGDLCSHDNGPLGDGEVEGFEVICPRHGARFDLITGKTLGLPAVIDIPAYPVRVTNGMIEVGVPK